MSDPGDVISFPVVKHGMNVQVNREMLPGTSTRAKFPRRHHTIEQPPTAEEKAAYKAYKRRWKAMEKVREDLIREGEDRGWATGDHGYEWEPARLFALEPRLETVYDETKDEWHARLLALEAHHAATGDWLEVPKPVSIMDVMAQDMAAFFDASVLGRLSIRNDREKDT